MQGKFIRQENSNPSRSQYLHGKGVRLQEESIVNTSV